MGGIFGPVFTLETRLASRRWQAYALRAAFVAMLLGCLWTTWREAAMHGNSGLTRRQDLVRAGFRFYYAMTLVEFVLVLLAASAATAGAICLDRSRGSLDDMLTTELTAREIVLGKLAARLLPVVALLACALPVSALAVLLGGVDPVALTGNFLVAVGLACLGCSLTMLVSVWGSRPHEVLAVVYAILTAWLLPRTIIDLTLQRPDNLAMRIYAHLDPFWVAMDSYDWFDRAGPASIVPAASFLAGAIALSALLATMAVRSLRPAMVRMANRKPRPMVESRGMRRFRRDVPWWPSPTLDRNPVLWREWHRSRPTPWIRAVWGVYLGVAGVAGLLLAIRNVTTPPDPGSEYSPINTLFVAGTTAFGLLLMSVTSATSLAEERARGSLDVLLTTPLSTRSVVWGKWRGTFRLAPMVLFWPAIVGYSMVVRIVPDHRLNVFYVMIPYGLAWSAFVTSLGLALATWTRRLGRALSIAVAINIALTIGVPFLVPGDWTDMLMPASPFFGMDRLASLMDRNLPDLLATSMLAGCLAWGAIYGATAAVLLVAVLLSFDRALGRAPERPRRPPPMPPRDVSPPAGSHASEARVGELLQRQVDRRRVP